MLGKIEDKRRRGHQRMRWLDHITNSTDMNFSKLLGDSEGQGSVVCCSPWGCRLGYDLATEQEEEDYFFGNLMPPNLKQSI